MSNREGQMEEWRCKIRELNQRTRSGEGRKEGRKEGLQRAEQHTESLRGDPGDGLDMETGGARVKDG